MIVRAFSIHKITILYLFRQISRTSVRDSSQSKPSNYATATTRNTSSSNVGQGGLCCSPQFSRKTAALSCSIPVLVLLPRSRESFVRFLVSDTRSLRVLFPPCLGQPARSSLPLVGNTWPGLLILLRAGTRLGLKILPRKYHPSCLCLLPALCGQLCCSRHAACTISIRR